MGSFFSCNEKAKVDQIMLHEMARLTGEKLSVYDARPNLQRCLELVRAAHRKGRIEEQKMNTFNAVIIVYFMCLYFYVQFIL